MYPAGSVLKSKSIFKSYRFGAYDNLRSLTENLNS